MVLANGVVKRNLTWKYSSNEEYDIVFNFIELLKFKKGEDELESVLDKWIYFIKNTELLDMVPKCTDLAEIIWAYNTAKMSDWSKHDLEVYDYWHMRLQYERGAMEDKIEKEKVC
ncbi:transposase [Candidatus Magnetobacterium bavaricum]|uniref:Transposase n=1 Tax=Candidatus Magnetobacterium bavaricum TaxID=29290 RepID=A0A0F3GS15_9BACT|nr:transposase [Candidatus Magnetobacterium bavaricum]